jgi:hypothetical protein
MARRPTDMGRVGPGLINSKLRLTIVGVRQSEVHFFIAALSGRRRGIFSNNQRPPGSPLAVHALLNGHRMRLAYALYRSPLALPVRPLLRHFKTSPYMPHHWAKAWRLFKIINFDYGYLRSVAQERPLDAGGDPYPWYTYPAVEYLKQLDFSNKTVFEYGCGHSTLFWAARAAAVVSVEHNAQWYDLVRQRIPGNCTLVHEPESDAYATAITDFNRQFDVIVIDGLVAGRTRLKCARAAVSSLRAGGMIILDNSDWLPESARHLRSAGLIQVDMTGFAPINDYTCTTSFFLHRAFAFDPLHDRQPVPGIGAHAYNWESGATKERLTAERDRRARSSSGETTILHST